LPSTSVEAAPLKLTTVPAVTERFEPAFATGRVLPPVVVIVTVAGVLNKAESLTTKLTV
jgi:hypothetical protein